MMQLPEDFDSIFRYIVVVSQRAEQLINGAKPRVEGRRVKRTLMARDDVDAGTVTWRILTQEELDAQRQAIVDQFRAEVGSDELATSAAPIPDVLPTRRVPDLVEADEAPETVERDDEISRLQRLLGMAGGAGPDVGRSASAVGVADSDVDDADDSDDFGDDDLALDLDDDFDSTDDDSDDDDDDSDDDD